MMLVFHELKMTDCVLEKFAESVGDNWEPQRNVSIFQEGGRLQDGLGFVTRLDPDLQSEGLFQLLVGAQVRIWLGRGVHLAHQAHHIGSIRTMILMQGHIAVKALSNSISMNFR